MPTGTCTLGTTTATSYGSATDVDRRLPAIVSALTEHRRVFVQSGEPIDDLVRSVWARLPSRIRRRTSVATWAFDNANNFALVALPKLAGIAISASDLVIVVEHAGHG